MIYPMSTDQPYLYCNSPIFAFSNASVLKVTHSKMVTRDILLDLTKQELAPFLGSFHGLAGRDERDIGAFARHFRQFSKLSVPVRHVDLSVDGKRTTMGERLSPLELAPVPSRCWIPV